MWNEAVIRHFYNRQRRHRCLFLQAAGRRIQVSGVAEDQPQVHTGASAAVLHPPMCRHWIKPGVEEDDGLMNLLFSCPLDILLEDKEAALLLNVHHCASALGEHVVWASPLPLLLFPVACVVVRDNPLFLFTSKAPFQYHCWFFSPLIITSLAAPFVH